MPFEDVALEPRIRTKALVRADRAVGASAIAAAEPVLIRLALIAFLLVFALLMLCGLMLGPLIRRIRRPGRKREPRRLAENREPPEHPATVAT